jgi:L-rhamnose-H+ transport protein
LKGQDKMNAFYGIILVVISGLGMGTVAWPMKRIKKLQFEHYWFIGMLVGLIIIPWFIVLTMVPHPFKTLGSVGFKPLLLANMFAVSWGIANVLYGICVLRIGAALTGALLSGLGLSIGSILPMIFKGSGLFSSAADIGSTQGLLVIIGVAVIIVGIALCTIAGFGRDKIIKSNNSKETSSSNSSGGFLGGLIMVIIAGITSAGIGLSFVYSQGPVVEAVKAQGASESVANIAVWASGLVGGALVNLIYPAYLMTKKKSWNVLFSSGTDVILAAVIGIQFIISIMMLGRGMLALGALGASIGFGIQQAMQINGNQIVGFMSGEWRGISGKPRMYMYLALLVLMLGVVVLAITNSIK